MTSKLPSFRRIVNKSNEIHNWGRDESKDDFSLKSSSIFPSVYHPKSYHNDRQSRIPRLVRLKQSATIDVCLSKLALNTVTASDQFLLAGLSGRKDVDSKSTIKLTSERKLSAGNVNSLSMGIGKQLGREQKKEGSPGKASRKASQSNIPEIVQPKARDGYESITHSKSKPVRPASCPNLMYKISAKKRAEIYAVNQILKKFENDEWETLREEYQLKPPSKERYSDFSDSDDSTSQHVSCRVSSKKMTSSKGKSGIKTTGKGSIGAAV